MEDVKPWEWNWPILVASAAVIVSLISAVIALFSAWRANKIAEKNLATSAEMQLIQFREKWIQTLREKMVEYISIYSTGQTGDNALKSLDAAANSILLMMNPEDDLYKELKNQLAVGIIKTVTKRKQTDNANLSEKVKLQVEDKEHFNANVLLSICQKILKKEWDRLKSDLKNQHAKNK